MSIERKKAKVKVTSSSPTLVDPMDCSLWNSPGQNTGGGSLSLLQGIFPTQGSNPRLPHCRWILYQLSHKGSLRILQWVACPFSSGPSWPRNRMGVSCIAGGFFTNWAISEVQKWAFPKAKTYSSILCLTVTSSPWELIYSQFYRKTWMKFFANQIHNKWIWLCSAKS